MAARGQQDPSVDSTPSQLARVALEALADDSDDVGCGRHLVVTKTVQQDHQPCRPVGSNSGELRAASGRQQRLQDPFVVGIRSELDIAGASGRVRELVSRLLANAERTREIGDRQAVR